MEIKTREILDEGTRQNVVRNLRASTKLGGFGLGLLLGAVIITGIFYLRNPQIFNTLTPDEQAKAMIKTLTQEVAKLMILPTGEDPTVLDITDPKALIEQQSFFTGAIAGDKLLVYKTAARAIVYSPSRHLIVNVGPVTNQQAAAEQTIAPTN
jgi:hypothetical protein